MSDGHDKFHFNAEAIFIKLFILTAVEVGWGYLAKDWGRGLLWGGLMGFAIWKALLIAVYFMHLKFEGWIIKGLILPTPILVLVIFGYVIPDVANKEGNLIHPVGAQLDPKSGEIQTHMEPRHGDEGGHGDDEHANDDHSGGDHEH